MLSIRLSAASREMTGRISTRTLSIGTVILHFWYKGCRT